MTALAGSFAVLYVATAMLVDAQVSLMQSGGTRTQPPPAVAVGVAPDSPRASYENFARLGKNGDWREAAQYLTLEPSDTARGALLARRLKLVLDQRLELTASSALAACTGRYD